MPYEPTESDILFKYHDPIMLNLPPYLHRLTLVEYEMLRICTQLDMEIHSSYLEKYTEQFDDEYKALAKEAIKNLHHYGLLAGEVSDHGRSIVTIIEQVKYKEGTKA